jgi:hypothetical protein
VGASRRTDTTDRRGVDDAVIDGDRRTEGTLDTHRGDRVDAIALPEGIRWGAITAGALATLLTFLLIGLLALGTDLLVEDDTGAAEDWISTIIGLIAFFVGGYVAGRALDERDAPSAGRDGRRGLTNGLLAWALATVLILVLSGLGLGQLFGPVGDLMVGTLLPEQIVVTARDAALGAFFALVLWALVSGLGGRLGGRADRRDEDRAART